ncbi:hypothetical protein [Malikia sp.]|uniref:hypothetical protein n=1 Tax=Malikia sp. TaxID=2070706 RepID=UPI002602000B|nr:hypothetical protein [Malikia sp.]MDD2729019.1 hypothetical protein [Malikia sp.]
MHRVLPVSRHYDGEGFWTLENGKRIATPLFIVLGILVITMVWSVKTTPRLNRSDE